jgi:phosphoglycerate dehydrogenase-like enzyme
MSFRKTAPRILVCSNLKLFSSFFTPAQQERLNQIGLWERHASRIVDGNLRGKLREVDALVTTWDSPVFTEELLQWAPALRMIGHCGGEVKRRFARPLFERLTITNAPAPMARHVAELAVTFLLYFAREIDHYREALRQASNQIYQELHLTGAGEQSVLNKTVGLIGLGRIGKAVVELLAPFGTRFLVYDPYVAQQDFSRSPLQFTSLEEVLKTSRFLIVAAALTDETTGLLDRRRLSLLPRGAAVINVARGGLVDLDALTAAVLRGQLRCALDVTDPLEPLPLRHPLRRVRGAIITPHVGAISRAVRQDIADIVLADLERFFAGEQVLNRVTPEMLDRMT